MIYTGGSAVADAKFGSQQLSTIYRGSDLIWSKNEKWVKCAFPSADNNCPALTSNTDLGFEFGNNSTCYKTLADEYMYLGQGALGSYTGSYMYLRFPPEWETIKITDATITGSSNYTNYVMRSYEDRNRDTAFSATIYQGGYNSTLVEETSGNTNKVNKTHSYTAPIQDLPETGAIKISMTKASDTKGQPPGRFFFTFWIREKRLEAWENKYNVQLARMAT